MKRTRLLNRLSRAAKAGIAAALVVGVGGCDVMGIGCEQIGVLPITVQVLDDATGMQVTTPTTVVIRDGTYADSVYVDDWEGLRSIGLGEDREGNYDVVVRAAGYDEWSRSDVRVRRSGGCDQLQAAVLTARLHRANTVAVTTRAAERRRSAHAPTALITGVDTPGIIASHAYARPIAETA